MDPMAKSMENFGISLFQPQMTFLLNSLWECIAFEIAYFLAILSSSIRSRFLGREDVDQEGNFRIREIIPIYEEI